MNKFIVAMLASFSIGLMFGFYNKKSDTQETSEEHLTSGVTKVESSQSNSQTSTPSIQPKHIQSEGCTDSTYELATCEVEEISVNYKDELEVLVDSNNNLVQGPKLLAIMANSNFNDYLNHVSEQEITIETDVYQTNIVDYLIKSDSAIAASDLSLACNDEVCLMGVKNSDEELHRKIQEFLNADNSPLHKSGFITFATVDGENGPEFRAAFNSSETINSITQGNIEKYSIATQ